MNRTPAVDAMSQVRSSWVSTTAAGTLAFSAAALGLLSSTDAVRVVGGEGVEVPLLVAGAASPWEHNKCLSIMIAKHNEHCDMPAVTAANHSMLCTFSAIYVVFAGRMHGHFLASC